MTGQSCYCSLHCFASTHHYSITSCFLTFLYNKSQCLRMSFFISVCPVSFSSAELCFPACLVLLSNVFYLSYGSAALSFWKTLFSFPFPPLLLILLSTSLQLLYNQSAGTSSLHPYIPKPLGPFCHPSFHRFPPPSFLPTVLCLPTAPSPFP